MSDFIQPTCLPYLKHLFLQNQKMYAPNNVLLHNLCVHNSNHQLKADLGFYFYLLLSQLKASQPLRVVITTFLFNLHYEPKSRPGMVQGYTNNLGMAYLFDTNVIVKTKE